MTKFNSFVLISIVLLLASCGGNSNKKTKKAEPTNDVQTPQIEIVEEVVADVKEMDEATAQTIASQIVAFYKTYGEHMNNDDERGVRKFLKVSPDFQTTGSDYDVFSQSQDPLDSYNVKVSKSSEHKDGFDVVWKGQYYSFHLVWLFVYEDGEWCLDDILEEE